MAERANDKKVEALDGVIREIESHLQHIRMQQKSWVADARRWLPALIQAREALATKNEPYQHLIEAHQAIWDALHRLGLDIKERENSTWANSWNGGAAIGSYPTPSQALEAALRERLFVTK
jgi:hypothetical protein